MHLANQTLQAIGLAPMHTHIQTARRRRTPPPPANQHPLSHHELPHEVGWDVGEAVEGTAFQMLLEIQHVPSTPPSPASCSTSPKYLLIFIYILCPRCPAPVRSHLLGPIPSCQLPPSSLTSGARS